MVSNTASKIADSSDNEETFKKNLVSAAKKMHGEDLVKQIGDNSHDEFDFIDQIKNLVNTPPKKQPTLESKYLEPYVYPALETGANIAGAIAKPFQYIAAPLGQAINATSNLIQGKPQEEFSNPIMHSIDYANQYGTTNSLMRTLPLGNEPISQMLPTTDTGNYLANQFPKATHMVRGISPNDIASIVADMGVAKSLPVPEVNIKAPISLETAADYVRSMAKDNKQLLELETSGKIYELAKMVQNDPDVYLHPFKPNRIYENLEGKINPENASRDRSTGMINKAVEKQNQFIEGLPRSEYSIPKEEIQREALANLNKAGTLEAGQRSAAENVIKNNIPIEQPDPVKIDKIRQVQAAQEKLAGMGKDISSERMILQSHIQAQKNALISAVNDQPDLIHNPKFRENLQWLSSIPIIEDQSNVYPKNTQSNLTNISKSEVGHGMMPGSGYSRDITTETNIPRETNYAPKNQNILDIAQGAQNEPLMIQNPEKSRLIGVAVEKLRGINDDLRDLMNKPTTAVNNKNLLAKIDQGNTLKQFVKGNFDPSTPGVEQYLDMIRARNEEPSGYASHLRRLGNKLQEPNIPGEVSTDLGAKNLAGRAIEEAGRNAQNMIMSSSDVPWQDVARYEDLNKNISNMINMKNLTQGNFVSDSAKAAEFVPSGMTGRSGGVGYVAKTLNRYIKPIGEPVMSSIHNAGQTLKTMQPSAFATNAPSMGYKSNLPMQLVSYQIPRDSNEILTNSHIVLAKIAQMAGDDPSGMVPLFQDAIENHPEQLPKVLPALVMKFPDLFAPDDYNRIDGKILDPQLKQKALKDIQNDRTMDIRTKAFKSKRLQEESILE